jgi:hypothetical protein
MSSRRPAKQSRAKLGPANNNGLLAKAEWDFERLLAEVSKKEIKVCYHYEFAREAASVRKQVAAIRNLMKASSGTAMRILSTVGDEWILSDAFPRDYLISIPPEYPVFFLNYPEWPEAPYFAIDRNFRQRRVNALIRDETTNEALVKRFESPLGTENPEIWPEIKLVIPSYYTHQQLVEAFAAYLRLHFPAQGKRRNKERTTKIGKRQGGAAEIAQMRADLRSLGVYRLGNQGKKAKQILELIRNSKGERIYSGEPAVSRARARATKRITTFESESRKKIIPFTSM